MKIGTLLPGVGHLRGYRVRDLRGDLSAGAVVAVMLVPQGMAYAVLAGLPPVMGLYASTVPLLVYALFGSSRHLAVGPVAIVSLLLAARCARLAAPGSEEYIGIVLTTALLVGLLQFLMGVLRLGVLTCFISHAVMSGFTSAAAITILLSQVKHVLGVPLEHDHAVLPLLGELVPRIGDSHLLTLAVGAACIGALAMLKRTARRLPAALFVVVGATAATFALRLDRAGLAIVGDLPAGLPSLSVPAVDPGQAAALLTTAMTVLFVGFVESSAVAQMVAAREGYDLDLNQELRALGLANVAASLFGGYPVSGGFSRTAVNHAAGARTTLASVVSAGLVLLTLLFLTPLFHYLPRAALGAVVIVAVAPLIDLKHGLYLFRLRPADGLVLLVTFLATLLAGVQTGVLSGVALSLALFIRRSAHPHMAELGYLPTEGVFRNVRRYPSARRFPGALILRIDASLYFANQAFVERHIRRRLAEEDGVRFVILDMAGVNDMDAVAVDALETLMRDYQEQGIRFLFAEAKGPVRDLLSRAGWPERYGPEAMPHSIEHALRTAGVDAHSPPARTHTRTGTDAHGPQSPRGMPS